MDGATCAGWALTFCGAEPLPSLPHPAYYRRFGIISAVVSLSCLHCICAFRCHMHFPASCALPFLYSFFPTLLLTCHFFSSGCEGRLALRWAPLVCRLCAYPCGVAVRAGRPAAWDAVWRTLRISSAPLLCCTRYPSATCGMPTHWMEQHNAARVLRRGVSGRTVWLRTCHLRCAWRTWRGGIVETLAQRTCAVRDAATGDGTAAAARLCARITGSLHCAADATRRTRGLPAARISRNLSLDETLSAGVANAA